MGSFDFLMDCGNYEQRKVDHFEKGCLVIDTCYASDTEKYETAVCDPKYNDNDWVIVEEYETKEKAKEGHNRWVKKMTGKKLPPKLKDVSRSFFAVLCDVGGEKWRSMKKKSSEKKK